MEKLSYRQIRDIIYNIKQYIFDNNLDKIKEEYNKLIEKNIIKPFNSNYIDTSDENLYIIYLLLYPYREILNEKD